MDIFEKVIDAIRTPFVKDENNIVFKHKDYEQVEKPIHYQPKIHHHVVQQHIINKDDFIEFVNEYKTPATKIFFNEHLVKAIFNYTTPEAADYGDSYAQMPLEKTYDFKMFQNMLDEQITQKTFVRFLKRMEPYIVAFDGKKTDDMDIIEMAENLQAITKVDSIVRNTANKFTIDAEVRTGKQGMTIPRIITFEFPVYRNDSELTTKFDVELFLSANDGAFTAELVCYDIDQLLEETQRILTASICNSIDGVKHFQV